MKPLFACVLAALSLTAATANANAATYLLSDLTPEANAAIQKDNTPQNLKCYDYVLNMIKTDQPDYAPANYFVTSGDDDVDGIAVGGTVSDAYYTCEKGVLSSLTDGTAKVLKTF